MKKINQKILSLPPYISTSWKNINMLYAKEVEGKQVLVVVLYNGFTIEIPSLESAVVEQIFSVHRKLLDQAPQGQSESLKQYEPKQNVDIPLSIGIPFQMGGGTNMLDQFGDFLHHNPEQSNAPDLPPNILNKIASFSRSLGMNSERANIPKAEPHCNCIYCQIARAIHAESPNLEGEGEEVSEEDLKFRDWDIKKKGDKLYEVTNPINQTECYQVFLGHPVGCTCGEKNCEHVRTVLNS